MVACVKLEDDNGTSGQFKVRPVTLKLFKHLLKDMNSHVKYEKAGRVCEYILFARKNNDPFFLLSMILFYFEENELNFR